MTASELDIMHAIGRHPNLLHFHGCSVHLEKCYFVVERAPFGSLRDYLLSVEESGPLKPVIALEIGMQVCRAMQQLHTLGIIHRDLAARNVLVFAISGRSHHDVLVKVSDFGLSRQAPSSANDYYGAEGGGMPIRWSAPEVLQRRKYSDKSDVWAFGVTLWEVLSLAMVPYYELTADEAVIRAVVGGTKLALPAGCPADMFERCMLPCWAATASGRPDFAALLLEVRAVQEGILLQDAVAQAQAAARAQAQAMAETHARAEEATQAAAAQAVAQAQHAADQAVAQAQADAAQVLAQAQARADAEAQAAAAQALAQAQAQTEAEQACCICMTRRSTNAMVPCGHLCLCNDAVCTEFYLPARRAQCPICRTPVASLLHVFS
jgi:hypothetical protein